MSSGTHDFQIYSKRRYEEGLAEGRTEGRKEGRDEARIETEQEAVLNVLIARGIGIGAEALERIRSCRDFNVLKTWLTRAATVDQVGEIFG